MKIDEKIINKIFEGKLVIKKKEDKIKLSKYEELIPMFDVRSERLYPIKKNNLYYRLVDCDYRFINKRVYTWFNNVVEHFKKKDCYDQNKIDSYQKMVDILNNYDLDILYPHSIETLYKYSAKYGLQISICKRNSFDKFSHHLKPYYTKDELIKLGLNMKVINENENYDVNDEDIHYQICKKIYKNDISSEEIQTHNDYIVKNKIISLISYYSFLGSYYMNDHLRNKKTGDYFLTDMINKFSYALKNSPPLSNDYFLYRLVWDDSYLRKIKINDYFVDRGFLSTTRDPFYTSGIEENFGLILIKIKIPKDTKGVGLLIENFSLFPKEEEFLLPPCTKLKLISKDEHFKYYHVDENFQRRIKKKYEFEYVENNFKEYTNKLITNFVKFDPKMESVCRTKLITKFINTYKINERELNIKFNGIEYTLTYDWFYEKDIYSDFYYNKSKGLLLSIYKNNYPFVNIELGEELAINYLNRFYYYDDYQEISNEHIELVCQIGKLFKYNEFKLFLEFKNFSEFCNNCHAYSNYYCYSIYNLLKNNKDFYHQVDKYKKYFDFDYGYWKLRKFKTMELPDKIKSKYPKSKAKTYGDIFIYVVENHFYTYKFLIEQLKKQEIDLENHYLTFDLMNYFNLPRVDFQHDDEGIKSMRRLRRTT